MAETEGDRRSALLRQRRFLILMSLALIAYYALGAGVSSEAQYSGLVFTLAQPDRAIWGLWIVWGWSVWRYAQRAYEQLSELRAELREDVFAEDMRIARKRAESVGNRLSEAGEFDGQMPTSARIYGTVEVEPPDDELLRAQAMLGERPTYFRGFIPKKDGGRKYPFKANFSWPVGGMEFARGNQHFAMELTRWETRWVRLRAWVWALVRLPAFSEHFAPLLIAIAAFGIGIVFQLGCDPPSAVLLQP
ncbi:MAG: hypothetical protein WD793_11045 [Steroidobacteraceae bacterium]